MNFDFTDKKVVITGACGVFGRRFVKAFAAAGARLCLCDQRSADLQQLAAAMQLDAERVLVHAVELCDADSIDDLVNTVARYWQAPDIVINNAGVYPSAWLLDVDANEWDRIMGVNLRAPFLLSRGMAKLMIAHRVKGNIIHISSGAARNMRVTSVPYCISKTALDRLKQGMALEFAQYGIRVNVVEPGFSPGSVVSPLSKQHVETVGKNIPLGRVSGEHDAASAVMFLCSQQAEYITGATLSVDGGNSLGSRVVFREDEEKQT